MDFLERVEVSLKPQNGFYALNSNASHTYYEDFLNHYARNVGICLECDDITPARLIDAIGAFKDHGTIYVRIR